METSLSPRRVLNAAYRLATVVFRSHSCKFSRHDFTWPQLVACLVLRQFYGLSYRKTEQLLCDSPQWLADIGLVEAPDHNTLWRAFNALMKTEWVNRMIDDTSSRFARAKLLRLWYEPLSIDSTCFERHHRSVHYDRRCRQIAAKEMTSEKMTEKPGSWGASVNAARRRTVTTMPKLSMAVASSCHLILAAKAQIGNGSDAPDFEELLRRSSVHASIGAVVADSGYDSEANHRLAREELKVRSIIPPGIGRPTSKLPRARWRRHMAKRFAKKADKKLYGQRSQSETVNSMIKRNQGSALRSRTPERQQQEMLLRALTHNIALLCREEEEREQG
jgi:IS5 family transposase